MTEFYTNLPPKNKDDLDKTIEKLTTTPYEDRISIQCWGVRQHNSVLRQT